MSDELFLHSKSIYDSKLLIMIGLDHNWPELDSWKYEEYTKVNGIIKLICKWF